MAAAALDGGMFAAGALKLLGSRVQRPESRVQHPTYLLRRRPLLHSDRHLSLIDAPVTLPELIGTTSSTPAAVERP